MTGLVIAIAPAGAAVALGICGVIRYRLSLRARREMHQDGLSPDEQVKIFGAMRDGTWARVASEMVRLRSGSREDRAVESCGSQDQGTDPPTQPIIFPPFDQLERAPEHRQIKG